MTDYYTLGLTGLIALAIATGVLTVWYIHKILELTKEGGNGRMCGTSYQMKRQQNYIRKD